MDIDEGTGNKLEVAEMRMLRWVYGVTNLDKIRNERIRWTTKVGNIAKKAKKGGQGGMAM